MVTTGIVGSGMPIANGLAWASQLRGEKRVTVANFGDGASNIGAFHESLNLASVWKLPVIFVCQNNRYAEHTPYADGTAVARIADRARAYGMPGIHVDGNDPIAMCRPPARRSTRARRRRADADRGDDLPLPRPPLRRRRRVHGKRREGRGDRGRTRSAVPRNG